MTDQYYIHFDSFDCKVPDCLFPSDVKRIFTHCDHTFMKRIYFISPSEKQIYRFFPNADCGEPLSSMKVSKSFKFNLLTDENKHDTFLLSDRLLKRIDKMDKVILPKLNTHI